MIFFFSPIPEITDSDMADSNELAAADTGYEDRPLRKQYVLFWGIVSQFSYVGAQVGVANYVRLVPDPKIFLCSRMHSSSTIP